MKTVTKIDKVQPLKTEKKILRVAAYCRVSTDSDAQLESLETQKKHYESYITSHIPARTKACAAAPPTPPRPTTATCAFFSFCSPLWPSSSSVRLKRSSFFSIRAPRLLLRIIFVRRRAGIIILIFIRAVNILSYIQAGWQLI